MEALHIAVLPRTARLDVDRFDAVLGKPCLHRLGDELTPVVAPEIGWCSVFLDGSSHPFEHIVTL